jgi:hypothetical protein
LSASRINVFVFSRTLITTNNSSLQNTPNKSAILVVQILSDLPPENSGKLERKIRAENLLRGVFEDLASVCEVQTAAQGQFS